MVVRVNSRERRASRVLRARTNEANRALPLSWRSWISAAGTLRYGRTSPRRRTTNAVSKHTASEARSDASGSRTLPVAAPTMTRTIEVMSIWTMAKGICSRPDSDTTVRTR